MEIRPETPPEYGEKVLFQEIPSNIDVKNPLIDEVMEILATRGFLEGDNEEVWTRLCLDEVFINAIKHGNKEDPDKKVKVSLFLDEKQWAIRVEDEGDGFSTETLPDTDPESELEHGRGLLLMESYMDEIWYYDRGNRVQLKKEKKTRLRKMWEKILAFFRLK